MKSLFLFALFALFATALPPLCPGREVRLTLGEVPAYAVTHNRDLAAAALRIREAEGRLLQSGRLANPELEVSHSRAVDTQEYGTEVAFTQRFPITARLRLERAVSHAQLAAAQAEYQEARRQVLLKAQTAAIRWLAVADRRAISELQLANSRELARFLEARVAAGEAPATDATLVSLEAQQLESELLEFEVEAATIAGELRPLLGVPAGESVLITGPLQPARPTAKTTKAAAENRPDLEAARHQAEAARRETALARANRWEDIGFGLMFESGKEEDAPEGFMREHRIGFRLSLPLPLWNRNQGRIAEAAAAAERARREVEALEAGISAEARATRNEAESLATMLEDFDAKILPAAQRLEEQLRATYETGQSSLTEVLRARDRRFQLLRRRSEILREYHLALTRHDAATGKILAGIPAPATSILSTTPTRSGK